MEGDLSPTWPQYTTAIHRRSSPPLLNPVVLILLVPILTLIVIFILIYSFVSYTSNISNSIPVKKGWDYFNILLVLLAILCGVFARSKDGASPSDESIRPVKSQPFESNPWYEHLDQMPESGLSASGGSQFRRNTSSYPDLRQAPVCDTWYNQFQFFDDFELDNYRSLLPPLLPEYNSHRLGRGKAAKGDDSDAKVIPVDTFEVVRSPPASASPPPPLPPTDLLPQRSFRNLPKNSNIKVDKIEFADSTPPQVEKRLSRSDRKKNGSTEEIGKIITDSKQSQGKRKIRQRIQNSFEKVEQSPPHPQSYPLPIPPPPPLSFYSIFRKGNKTKRVHSISAQQSPPTPPPLPPSPRSKFTNIFKSGSKNKQFQNQSSFAPPPPALPLLPHSPRSIFNNMFKSGNRSKRFQNQSVSAQPPPPRPPPSSIFNNLFQNGSKSKRYQNQSRSAPPPPPPPPPPPSSIFNDTFKSSSKSKRFYSAATPPPPMPPRRQTSIFSGRPPLPTKTRDLYHGGDEIPAPPPLQPFWMRETSFVARGDFVGIRSMHSPRCSSPEPEDIDLLLEKETPVRMDSGDGLESVDVSSGKEIPDEMDGGDGLGRSVTCPSPDVNTKADSFIAMLKGEWRLEKLNSLREKMDMSQLPSSSPKSY